MTQELIEGVKLKKLAVNPDERGRLMEILRCDDELFTQFGQVYLTTAYPGVVKAWHLHAAQTDNFAVVSGMMKVVLYDSRPESDTCGMINEFFLGDRNPGLLQIPPGVCHGFKCISEHEALVINIPDKPYNRAEPDEQRFPAHMLEIPYEWARQDG